MPLGPLSISFPEDSDADSDAESESEIDSDSDTEIDSGSGSGIITLIDAIKNLADNTVDNLAHSDFITSTNTLFAESTPISEVDFQTIKDDGKKIGYKKKIQFARYITPTKEETVECNIEYWKSPIADPFFYKIFKYGEQIQFQDRKSVV